MQYLGDSRSPLFSIVMPAFNAANFVRQAIESILHQTYGNWELLVADDGSADDTRSAIASFDDPRIQCFHNDRNIGYLRTCNQLFQKCAGEFITFQDADDYSHPQRLQGYFDFFKSNPQIDVCGTDYYQVSPQGVVERTVHFPPDATDFPDEFPLIGATLCIKRTVYQDIGGYHEYFDRIGSEDFYWFGLMLKKFRFANISTPLYYYRRNPDSLSKSNRDVRSQFGHDIVRFLIQQQSEFGTDSLHDPAKARELQRFVSANTIKHLLWNRRYGDALAYSILHPLASAEVFFRYVRRQTAKPQR